jgi:hypothetical protein
MNSPFAIKELSEIVGKLYDRSLEGKIIWEESLTIFSPSRDGVIEALDTDLGSGLQAVIEVTDSKVFFFLTPTENSTRLLEIEFDRKPPRFGFDSRMEEATYQRLVSLHELARRSAFHIDERVERVKDFLDKLGS